MEQPCGLKQGDRAQSPEQDDVREEEEGDEVHGRPCRAVERDGVRHDARPIGAGEDLKEGQERVAKSGEVGARVAALLLLPACWTGEAHWQLREAGEVVAELSEG